MTTELYHHGVKGQHWGKRNGPPYPLYRKSAYYKKTGKRPPGYTGNKSGSERSSSSSKSGKIGKLIEYDKNTGLLSTPGTRFNQRHGLVDDKSNITKKGRAITTAASALAGAAGSAMASKGLSTKQRLAIAGTSAATSALAGNVGARLYGRIRRAKGNINKKVFGSGNKGNKSGKESSSAKGKIGAFWDSPEVKAEKKYNKAYRKNYIDAYNKAADAMNNGGIAKYNANWEKKYGKIDYNNPKFNREKYEGDYNKQFNALVDKNIRSVIGDPPKKRGSIGGYNDDNKRRSDLKRKILKGAGVAAGAAALAGAGYLAYRNRAAIGSKAGKLRDDIRYRLGEIPGTAKLNQTRINLKNKILGAGKKAKGLVNEAKTPTSALRNDIRLVGASAKGAAKNVGNTARNAGAKVRNVAAKPGQTVYNKIAGKSKAALKVAKNESQVARNNARTLKNFIDDNAKSIEKTTIAKRQALAKIRRGEGNLNELNRTANNLAVREKALIAKQNTARALAPKAVAERVSKAEAVRQAQAVFTRRNKLGRIAAGATNAGIGLGLAGAASGAGYGISRLTRKRRSRRRRRR